MRQQQMQQDSQQYQYRDIVRLMPELRKHAAAGEWGQAQQLAAVIFSLQPENRKDLETLAGVYIDCGNADQCREILARLEQICGMNAYGCFLSARLAFLQGNWQTAKQEGEKALSLGDLSRTEQCLVHDILGRTAKELGDADEAAEQHLTAAKLAEDIPAKCASYSNYLLDLHYTTESAEDVFRASQHYDAFFSGIQGFRHAQHAVHEKLRIGYISPDLHAHIAAYFSWAMFQSYDRASFDIYCYANCEEDAISQTFAALSGHWCNISSMTPQEAAQKIYEDEIDILVDLAGHTQGSCLPVLAYCPAPVQVSGIGYMSTTGMAAVDYFISDVYLEAMESQSEDTSETVSIHESPFFSEKLLVLPHSHFCYRPPELWHPCAPAPYHQNGYITFGCFNAFAKLTSAVLEAWRKLLQYLPTAHLFLKAAVFDHEQGRETACRKLLQAGLPMERLTLEGYTDDYLSAYERVDIALDTYPYTGGGTTCDALYMGVPVITLSGSRHGTRFGRSLLMNAGLEECCTASWEEYIACAAALAQNESRLAEIHQTLRRRMQESVLIDQGMYMAELEDGYRLIWDAWCRQDKTPETVLHKAKERSIRLLAALQCSQWEVVVREAGFLHAMGCCSPQAVSAAGFSYMQRKDYGRAAFWLRRALRENPENELELRVMLAAVLRESLNTAGAARVYEGAWSLLEHNGSAALSFQNQLLVDKGNLTHLLGRALESAQDYLRASRQAANRKDACDLYSSYLLVLHCTDIGEAELDAAHADYQKLLADVQPYAHSTGRCRPQKLRIGYISPDFRQHVMFHFYYALLACADREHFTIYCYSTGKKRDDYTEKVRSMADVWRDISDCTYEDAAQRIYEDQIDILVDLAGHTADSGLPVLAWKPAPVQVSGLGYMHRTGLPAVDYFITDKWCDPGGEQLPDFEKPLYLTSQFTYAADGDVPAVQGTPCRQTGRVLFGVFNHYYKITDEMLLAWKEILQRVPDSRLLLKSQVMVSPSAVDIAYDRLKRLGFSMDRVIFEPATTNYMQRYLTVDIALDTYPYTGGGTTCDALYMGIPVISMYGERRGSRFGKSILENAGAGRLSAASRAEYIELAAALAHDVNTLDALHLGLRELMQHSTLMDGAGYVHALEGRYEEIWQQAMQRNK